MKTRWGVAAVGAVMLVTLVADLLYAPPTVFPRGVTIHKPGLVYPGYVIYVGGRGAHAFGRLIDLDGNQVHTWRSPYPASSLAHIVPLPEPGHVLARVNGAPGVPSRIVEMDWDGNVVWEFEEPAGVLLHHDHQKLENGNYMLLCSKMINVPSISNEILEDDCLMEVNPQGDIVWEWQTADHFDDFLFDMEVIDSIFESGGDWAHANAAYPIPEDTSHADPRFAPGNIVLSYRFISSVAIVDKQTGDIVWRTAGQTVGQHDSHVMPDSLPGGGNVLVFDNGFGEQHDPDIRAKRASRVVEIDPTDFSEVWQYDATASGMNDWAFNSWFISGAQRQPNGNTLINEGAWGRFFEVTPSGEIVWEFVNRPVADDPASSTFVYRAYKVEVDWPPAGTLPERPRYDERRW